MSNKIKYFPFETYIHSCCEKEYGKDVRKKNLIIKYINLLSVDHTDSISLKKLALNLMFFRNTFTKDEFLFFFLTYFSDDEKQLLAKVVFDMFVFSEKGEIGEDKRYHGLMLELYSISKNKLAIKKQWEEIKSEMIELM